MYFSVLLEVMTVYKKKKKLYSKHINNIQGRILHVFIKYIKVNEEKIILRASGGNLY